MTLHTTTTTTTEPTATTVEPTSADLTTCERCGIQVPQQNLTVHSLRCGRVGGDGASPRVQEQEHGHGHGHGHGMRRRKKHHQKGKEKERKERKERKQRKEHGERTGDGEHKERGERVRDGEREKEKVDGEDNVYVEDVTGLGSVDSGGRSEERVGAAAEEEIDDLVAFGAPSDDGDRAARQEHDVESGDGVVRSSVGANVDSAETGTQGGHRDERMMCQFCNISYPLWEIVDHAEACGSRTDVCPLCNGYVRLKDMWRHRESGCEVAVTGRSSASGSGHGVQEDVHGGGIRREFENLMGGDGPDGERIMEFGRNALRRARSRIDEVPSETRRAVGAAVGAAAALTLIGLLRR